MEHNNIAGGAGRPNGTTPSVPISAAHFQRAACSAFNETHRFFSAIFLPSDRIYCYPLLRDHENRALDSVPKEVDGRATQYQEPWGEWKVLGIPTCYSTTLRSRNFVRQMEKLALWNDAGYGVYFTPNPLSSKKRCQRTLRGARWLVMESDRNTIEDQQAYLARHRSELPIAVLSGGRSIHMYRPISIRNPACLERWQDIDQAFHDSNTSCRLPGFKEAALAVEAQAKAEGITLDHNPLIDPVHLYRVPGFRHDVSGQMTKVLHLDNVLAPIPIVVKNSQPAPESITVCRVVPPPASSPPLLEAQKQPVSVKRSSFLDDLETYERLKQEGIPHRHVRRELHRVLFVAARLHGWYDDEDRVRQEWRQIVEMHPDHIGCTSDVAVQEIIEHRRLPCQYKFRLPNCNRLPPILEDRLLKAQAKLGSMGCPDPVSAARILGRVCWPRISTWSSHCLDKVPVRAVEIQQVAVYHDYMTAKDWLHDAGLMVCEERRYHIDQRSRLYRINIPLVLWVFGFRTIELDWSGVKHEAIAQRSGDHRGFPSGGRLGEALPALEEAMPDHGPQWDDMEWEGGGIRAAPGRPALVGDPLGRTRGELMDGGPLGPCGEPVAPIPHDRELGRYWIVPEAASEPVEVVADVAGVPPWSRGTRRPHRDAVYPLEDLVEEQLD